MVFDSKEYMKAYYLTNKDKYKAYNKTYNGLRTSRIQNWKQTGIIIDDYQHYYDTVYFPAPHCQICKVEFCKEANTSTSKNLDHDHSIEDRPNVRNIVCHGCNNSSSRTEMFKNNTSGHANIHITPSNTYLVRIRIRKKLTSKSFKTLNEAILFRDKIKQSE
mgnify:CR=1 FL=1